MTVRRLLSAANTNFI